MTMMVSLHMWLFDVHKRHCVLTVQQPCLLALDCLVNNSSSIGDVAAVDNYLQS